MNALTPALPEQSSSILVVGKDVTGEWSVQEGLDFSRRHFASFDAAMTFARAERQSHPDATIAVSCAPLVALLGC